VCAVAARNHDGRDAGSAQQPRGAARILGSSGCRYVEIGDARKALLTQVSRPLDTPCNVTGDASAFRHHHNSLDAEGCERGEHRSTMLARSAICRLAAFATTRLMPRADTGFAMMPITGRKAFRPGALSWNGKQQQ
jgi:hypothetical protein